MSNVLSNHETESIMNRMQRMNDRIHQRTFDIYPWNGGADRVLDDRLNEEIKSMWKPSIELRQKDNKYVVDVALPGVDARDVNIEVTPGEILLKAKLHHEHKEDDGDVHICEFTCGNTFRSIPFPAKVDPDKVKAELRNGILTVTAEMAEARHSKRITIHAA